MSLHNEMLWNIVRSMLDHNEGTNKYKYETVSKVQKQHNSML